MLLIISSSTSSFSLSISISLNSHTKCMLLRSWTFFLNIPVLGSCCCFSCFEFHIFSFFYDVWFYTNRTIYLQLTDYFIDRYSFPIPSVRLPNIEMLIWRRKRRLELEILNYVDGNAFEKVNLTTWMLFLKKTQTTWRRGSRLDS